ncbi:HK97 gp10 family phage protein [Dehalobacter sp. DCM]|uniref:HK97-gp10 family putative phage morphogenesis protein n=1 Tax=Dehalobacter sp. DCM TaxID=2907827 RepID=UPI00308212E4|nr:HK97 gp10 family phage protein [Dehalobacter sp. DCM]
MNNVIGVKEVRVLFERVGKAPAKVMTKATKAGANLIKTTAKNNAPVGETGALKSGITIKAEKYRKGKKVYQIFMKSDPRFVKISKTGKRAFYPASQEYGWTDQYGHYHPGYRYMKKAADSNSERAKGLMIRVMAEELEKLR